MRNSRALFLFSPKTHARSEQKHFQHLISGPNTFFRWFFTFLVLGTVLVVAFNLSEERGFLKLMEEANPEWIVAGLGLQSLTYLAQTFIWKSGLRATGHKLEVKRLYGLSLAQLFINQAIPSVSVSGAYFIARAFAQRGVPRSATSITLGLSLISYFEAYALVVLLSVIQLRINGQLGSKTFLFIFTLILLYSVVLVPVVRKIPGELAKGRGKFFLRFHFIRNLIKAVETIDFNKLRPGLIIKATLWQLLVFIFDFLTLWAMIRALGISASGGPVFTAYMAAYLARTVGLLPGGIGIFEAAAMASLHRAGITVAGSIAATLLYRGLSFWLPMLPGLFLVRREFHHRKRNDRYKIDHFWTLNLGQAMEMLKSCDGGISRDEARRRLILQGPNQIQTHKVLAVWEILWGQIRSPLLMLLVFASAVSFFVGEWIDAMIILSILIVSSGIGTWREWEAQSAIGKLKSRLSPKVTVVRDSNPVVIASSELVPGDIVTLSAGALVPADLLVMTAQDCYVNEAAITGESFPVLKSSVPEGLPLSTSLNDRKNSIYLGSHIETGMTRALVVNTGVSTMFGALSESLTRAAPQTEFDRNITSFGFMMVKAMLLIVITVFAVNSLSSGLTIQSLMFAVALAVGLSPELLPLIINYDLAMSAQRLAAKGLLVRHPKALENIAAADILCTDKTGTLTEGVLELEGALAADGTRSSLVLKEACLNATFQAGITNPLDVVLMKTAGGCGAGIRKIGEIPFDFHRKRLSVIVEEEGSCRVITKGAFLQVLEVSGLDEQGKELKDEDLRRIRRLYEEWSGKGGRVLGVAVKSISPDALHELSLENDMRFLGILVFTDRPKEGITRTLKELKGLGVDIKIISGDNSLVTMAVARQVGLEPDRPLEGNQIDALTDDALSRLAESTMLFTQVDPHQKERIVSALRKKGHTVAYMGDGINDVSSMHASDASISVDTAVDIAKNTADLVLLDKSLELIKEGIREGRTTFNNSMKYINITMSANLGNMISMAIASVLLPFLPLLASQVLLNNLLSDIPSLGLASDNVDEEKIGRPTKWDLRAILRYMLAFGLISTVFDLLTFYLILRYVKASLSEFRTAWFIESLLTELLVIMVLRTSVPFYRSRPSNQLLILTVILVIVTLMIPYMMGADLLGFVPLRSNVMALVLTITCIYLFTTEIMKTWLHRNLTYKM